VKLDQISPMPNPTTSKTQDDPLGIIREFWTFSVETAISLFGTRDKLNSCESY
jgi:hypothetical protein